MIHPSKYIRLVLVAKNEWKELGSFSDFSSVPCQLQTGSIKIHFTKFLDFCRELHGEVGEQDDVLHRVCVRAGHLE